MPTVEEVLAELSSGTGQDDNPDQKVKVALMTLRDDISAKISSAVPGLPIDSEIHLINQCIRLLGGEDTQPAQEQEVVPADAPTDNQEAVHNTEGVSPAVAIQPSW